MLLDGVVRAKGRVWVASQPDVVLYLESAGGGLQVGSAGAWLAHRAPVDPVWDTVDAQRRALAALRWDPEHGDRDTELVVLCHATDPADVLAALTGALLTDEEMALGQGEWTTWVDPFADHHCDPCTDTADAEPGTALTTREPQP